MFKQIQIPTPFVRRRPRQYRNGHAQQCAREHLTQTGDAVREEAGEPVARAREHAAVSLMKAVFIWMSVVALSAVSSTGFAQSCPALEVGQSNSTATAQLKALRPSFPLPQYPAAPCMPDILLQEPLGFPVCVLGGRLPVEKLVTLSKNTGDVIDGITYTFSHDEVEMADLLRFVQSAAADVSWRGFQPTTNGNAPVPMLAGAAAFKNALDQWLIIEDTTPVARGVVAEKLVVDFPSYRITVSSDELLRKIRSPEVVACVAEVRQ